MARGKRLSDQAELLLSRHSSEDLLYALFFVLHAYVIEMPLVRHTVNPTWEKGAVRNAAEFASMCTKCGDIPRSAISPYLPISPHLSPSLQVRRQDRRRADRPGDQGDDRPAQRM